MSTLPDAIGKAAPVSVAAAAVADGIVRRKRRVYAPRWVPLLLDLRTAVYHLDGLLGRNKRLRNAIREANANVA
ncbi:short chain dehydrogenase [Mycobacteroides abscessus]|nr:short chain dehydrogenase [Mycobacteroides abscessus]